MMDPKDNTFKELSAEQEEGAKAIGSMSKASRDFGFPVFRIGEDIPLRGNVWRVKAMHGSDLVLESLGPTKKAQKAAKR